MKTSILILILTLGLLPGITPQAEARHGSSQYQIYISGYQRCGTPIYMMRYIAGYDRCGRAVWRVRHLSRGELQRYQRSRHCRSYAGYGQSRISYSTSSGRGYTYRYYSSSPSRCRSW